MVEASLFYRAKNRLIMDSIATDRKCIGLRATNLTSDAERTNIKRASQISRYSFGFISCYRWNCSHVHRFGDIANAHSRH